ncbi:hypothetical protein N0V92_006238 [Colletotrichum tropicale]|nr:hypothetical protein N0V92_006238 [Colletotrichum tropicale]
MTAGGADNGANTNTNGAAKQRRRAKKAKRTKKAGSAIKSDRLKSLDLLQKIGLALKAKRDASSTDDAARQQKAPKTPAAQEGVHSVLTSKKRARSPEGSEALSDPFYHGLEEFISDEESAIMPPNRKRVRFNEPEPVREATEADGPELGVAAEESPTSSLEVLELAEEPLAPRVFVTPNPKANQPVIRVVTMDAEQEFAQKIIDGDDTPVSYFDFGPDFQLSDLHIHEILLRRPSFFQHVVRITAGSPKIRLPLTDTGLVRLVTACPILEDLSINGGTHLSDRSVAAVISKCKNIRHLAFCGANFEPNNVCGAALHQLVGTSVVTNLEEIVPKNTKVYEATVKRLRDERPGLKISHSG